MKFWKFILTISTLLLTLSSCIMLNNKADASDEIIEKQIDIGQIIELRASSDLIIVISPSNTDKTIVIRGSENVVDALNLEYDGHRCLSASLKWGTIFRYQSDEQKAHLYISSDDISHFTCSSGANITVVDTLNCETDLNVKAMSGGIISFENIETPRITVKSLSGGCIRMNNVITDNLNVNSYTGGVIQVSGMTNSICKQGDTSLINTDNLNITN